MVIHDAKRAWWKRILGIFDLVRNECWLLFDRAFACEDGRLGLILSWVLPVKNILIQPWRYKTLAVIKRHKNTYLYCCRRQQFIQSLVTDF